MKKTKVLVTGAGGEGAVGLIRILKDFGIEVFSCDCTKFASGLYLADKGFLIPKAKEREKFIEKIKKEVGENRIEIILCMVHDELPIFASLKEEFKEKFNCEIISSPLKTVEICNNKLKTIEILKEIVPCPEIYKDNIRFPCFVKPRNSSGSKNSFEVGNEKELNAFLGLLERKGVGKDDLIIQEYLPGKEYTVDILCDFDGKLVVAVPRERILTKGGISTIGKTEKNERVLDYIEKITKKLDFSGPANIQFKEDSSGIPKILEINPRFSGGLMITLLSGVNTLQILFKLLFNEKIDENELEWKEKTIFRYLSEIKK